MCFSPRSLYIWLSSFGSYVVFVNWQQLFCSVVVGVVVACFIIILLLLLFCYICSSLMAMNVSVRYNRKQIEYGVLASFDFIFCFGYCHCHCHCQSSCYCCMKQNKKDGKAKLRKLGANDNISIKIIEMPLNVNVPGLQNNIHKCIWLHIISINICILYRWIRQYAKYIESNCFHHKIMFETNKKHLRAMSVGTTDKIMDNFFVHNNKSVLFLSLINEILFNMRILK